MGLLGVAKQFNWPSIGSHFNPSLAAKFWTAVDSYIKMMFFEPPGRISVCYEKRKWEENHIP